MGLHVGIFRDHKSKIHRTFPKTFFIEIFIDEISQREGIHFYVYGAFSKVAENAFEGRNDALGIHHLGNLGGRGGYYIGSGDSIPHFEPGIIKIACHKCAIERADRRTGYDMEIYAEFPYCAPEAEFV